MLLPTIVRGGRGPGRPCVWRRTGPMRASLDGVAKSQIRLHWAPGIRCTHIFRRPRASHVPAHSASQPVSKLASQGYTGAKRTQLNTWASRRRPCLIPGSGCSSTNGSGAKHWRKGLQPSSSWPAAAAAGRVGSRASASRPQRQFSLRLRASYAMDERSPTGLPVCVSGVVRARVGLMWPNHATTERNHDTRTCLCLKQHSVVWLDRRLVIAMGPRGATPQRKRNQSTSGT